MRSRTSLTRTSPTSYRLLFPDGSQHLFSRPVGPSNSRKVFLTRIIDARGNGVDLIYDASNRLTAIVDSLGQVSTLSYELASDIYKVTKITDPFGRFAAFRYSSLGQLTNITDAIGINSGFTYGSNEFIDTLTTPYGTSRFQLGENGPNRWLEMTDPEGGTERVEFRHQAPGISFLDTIGVPKGINPFNQYLSSRNTYYWDKKASREAAGDYTKARIMHWLHDININVVSGILESEKQPLENRVWYNYPNQIWGGGINAGMIGKPAKVGRILDDGSTQLYEYEYNDLGNLAKQVDPVGRTTVYVYGTNLIDLLEVRQTAGVNDLLETRTYNAQHLPLTVANGSGHTNRYTYNAAGQLLTVTNPRDETTTYKYDTNGYLLSIDAALPGTNDLTSFAYDVYGRVRTITDSEGYTLTYSYDALDRLTRITYPDTTYDENIYHRLDRVASRDRNGRVTLYTYDANRRLTSVEDPLHRITRYDWCSCGELGALIDPMNRTTRWHRDIQGRVTAKEYVDGSQVRYAYESTTSRLKTVTDEKGQVKLYDYLPDNNLQKITYLNAENPTPNVILTYDGPYNRIKTMTDGIGLTTYGYHSPSRDGGRLAFVDGPLPNDLITYDYDELDRVERRAINGVEQRTEYDAIGRATVVTNILGTFLFSCVNSTYRSAMVLYPNGVTTEHEYYDNFGNQRLRRMHHRLQNNQTLSHFEYAYDAVGQITNWIQQNGAEISENWAPAYDSARQLLSVVVTATGFASRSWDYSYDLVGNRKSEASSEGRRAFVYNFLNQVRHSDETATNDRTFHWDAEQRLVRIVDGSSRQEIAYDGLGRYAEIKDWERDTLISHNRFLWCGNDLCEILDGMGAVARRRFFSHGQENAGQATFYTRDHLSSIRSWTDRNGTVLGSQSYSPFGYLTRSSGIRPDLGFTGHYFLARAGLLLARYRAFDASLGRWLSRDLVGEEEGPDLYQYVSNDPVNLRDPLGLRWEYSQTTGVLTYVDNDGNRTTVVTGYSGNGPGLNNAASQNQANVGPIPQGNYTIGPQRNSGRTGPGVMDLTPNDGTETFGRGAFQFHGDNHQGNQSASRGCVILPRWARDRIAGSSDNTLRVIP